MSDKPVAWMTIDSNGEEDDIWYDNPEGKLLEGWSCKPLYTHPQHRTWVGLSDEERHQVMQDRTWMHTEGLCQAIETKLKEKNT